MDDIFYSEKYHVVCLGDFKQISETSEGKYKSIADSAYDWEMWEDSSGHLEYISPSCKRISGYSSYEFTADPLLFDSIVIDEDKAAWANHQRETRVFVRPHTAHFRIRNRNGYVVWIEQVTRNVVDKNGTLLGCHTNNRDVSERKTAEETHRKSEDTYKLLFENAVESIIVIQDSNIMLCNPKAQELVGYTEEEIITKPYHDFVYSEDLITFIGFLEQKLQGLSDSQRVQFRIVRHDGEIRWVECAGIRISWNDEPASLNFAVDITDRKKAQDALKKSEEKYRLLAEHASDVIWILSINELRYTYISPAIYQLRGLYADEALQESLDESLTPASSKLVKESIAKNADVFVMNPLAPNHYIYDIQQPCKDGSVIWVEISTKYRYSSDGEIEIVGVSRNIEERKKNEEEILYLSYYDQLTGLYNRRFYEEELRRLNTPRNLPITIIMADVDGLKLANDAFGHQFGDRLLQTAADIIKSESRSDDIIARTGGDEFIILLPKTSSAGAEIIVNRIRNKIAATKLDGMNVSVSFGYASKINPEDKMEKVFAQAEDRMYRRKLLDSNITKSDTIKMIAKSLREKDCHEQAHSERVSEICRNIGLAMEFAANEISELELLGKMHDIGMIGMSEAIINKPTNLDPDEWLEMKRHPEIGYQILRSVSEYAQIAEYVLCHHERIDGNGYPRNLKTDQIPIQSKILSIAEAYDSMTGISTYRKPFSTLEAINELRAHSNTQFDERIVGVFVDKVISAGIAI